MIRKESDCVDCTAGMYCLGSFCPHWKQRIVMTCDECGLECDETDSWDVDGKIICDDCIMDYLKEKGTIKRPKISDYI